MHGLGSGIHYGLSYKLYPWWFKRSRGVFYDLRKNLILNLIFFDFELFSIIERVLPRLSHRNPAVVFSAV